VAIRRESSASHAPADLSAGFWLDPIARAFAKASVPFEMSFPDGALRHFGQGASSFSVRLKNKNAVRAITSLDQVKFADAYLAGDIDIDGNMLRLFELRQTMGDLYPLMTAWRFLQPLLLGQVRTNKAAITLHYDVGAEFLLSLLDPRICGICMVSAVTFGSLRHRPIRSRSAF
jgi:cyclopropane-fatty-acyl-phospholipid synthase